MGLLDSLFQSDGYGGQGGGLLDFLRNTQMQNQQYQPGPGFPQPAPPATFADRFNAVPNAPQPVMPSGRQFDPASFDPSTYSPSASPIAIGDYMMQRVGKASDFEPSQAAIPPNAQPAQGQLPPTDVSAQSRQPEAPQQQQALPPALGGGNYIDNLRGGAGLIGSFFGGSSQQKNLKAQYDSLVPVLGQQKALLAVMNPVAGKTLLEEALSNKEKFQQTGEDSFGNKTFGFVNERDQTINGKDVSAATTQGGGSGFLAPGVKQVDSTLQGKDYLGQFSPEVQAAVQNYVDGKSTPTGNPRKGFTQAVKMIAQKYGSDTGQSVDDATYAARRTMRNQLSSSAPASLGGQINIGNTAAGHLADLSQKALELGNYDTGIAPLTSAVNSVRGLGTEQAAKMEALKGAAQHYGQEITKFYAGSPGGTAERDRFIESVNGARSPKELAAILATEGELMRSRLDALGGQIKGVLGDEGAKEYPVLRKDGQTALAKVEENVSKLKGGQGGQATQSTKPTTVMQNGHTYNLQPDGSYK